MFRKERSYGVKVQRPQTRVLKLWMGGRTSPFCDLIAATSPGVALLTVVGGGVGFTLKERRSWYTSLLSFMGAESTS